MTGAAPLLGHSPGIAPKSKPAHGGADAGVLGRLTSGGKAGAKRSEKGNSRFLFARRKVSLQGLRAPTNNKRDCRRSARSAGGSLPREARSAFTVLRGNGFWPQRILSLHHC